jgi:hypothetical protein
MRILLHCMKCRYDAFNPDAFYPAELQDNGLYWMKCRRVHETVTCLQEQKFELLFDLAANAIVDGYYREAVSSFTSALECFYEFYVQVICEKSSISEDAFAATWKRVAAQSERQLGAFTFLYLIETGKPPGALSNTMISFRNDVIHRGKLPKKEEAVKYGQEILELIAPVLEDLKAHREEISKVVGRHISKPTNKSLGSPPSVLLFCLSQQPLASPEVGGSHSQPLKIRCGNLNRNGDGQNGKELRNHL